MSSSWKASKNSQYKKSQVKSRLTTSSILYKVRKKQVMKNHAIAKLFRQGCITITAFYLVACYTLEEEAHWEA